MQSPSSPSSLHHSPLSPEGHLTASKYPLAIFDSIFAFAPNRDTLGATAYFIVENGGNILIDSPAWDENNQQFLQAQGGAEWLFLTHRGAIGRAKEWQQFLGCQVLIQEQEAYLLPEVKVQSFHQEFTISSSIRAIWTPGHSPGSACLHCSGSRGILFSGRHLLPNQHGEPVPLRLAKTFHWQRQLNSIKYLLEEFSGETLSYICPGANTGFLRGKRMIDNAYHRLAKLDLTALAQLKF